MTRTTTKQQSMSWSSANHRLTAQASVSHISCQLSVATFVVASADPWS